MSQEGLDKVEWHRVGDSDVLAVGRLTTLQISHTSVCLTRTEEGYGAISNRCPHQGGPLGDGFLQNGYVVCPWHGWEYHPCTGNAPSGYRDEAAIAYPVEEREDGLYIGVPEVAHRHTLMDQMVDVMTEWGVDTVFGMVVEGMEVVDKIARVKNAGSAAHNRALSRVEMTEVKVLP